LTATGTSSTFITANAGLTWNGAILNVAGDVSANTYNGPGGTAGAPHFTSSDDRTTGIFMPAAGREVAFTSAGVERGRFDLSGLRMITGTIRNLSGSVAAPSYTFFNDLSMGLYDPATNVLGFVTSGVERLRVDASGNVGIGTTAPICAFDIGVASTTANEVVSVLATAPAPTQNVFKLVGARGVATGGDGDISTRFGLIYQSGGTTVSNSSIRFHRGVGTSGGFMSFSTSNDSERMRVDAIGRVGIGTTTPQKLLDLSSAIGSDGIIVTASNAQVLLQDPRVTGAFQLYSSSTSFGLFTNNTTLPCLFHTSNAERMRIDVNGRIGIGTTAPASALDISGQGVVLYLGRTTPSDGLLIQGYSNAGYIRPNISGTLYLGFNNNIAIFGSGKVGVMCNSPQQFLDVGAAQGGYSSTFWGFVSGGGLGNAAPAAYSIQTLSNILSTGFYTYSDQRIKTNIIDLSDDQCLQQIRAIEPKRYEYIDKVERGSNPVYGFIAQQIRDVLPYAVTLQPGVVPDIQDMADFSNNIVTLRTKTFSFNDVSGNVRIITSDPNKALQSYPVSFISSNQLRIDCSFTDVSDVFVYGREIPDYHQLDKNAIFTINVAATQELDRQLQAAKGKIQQLEDTLSNVLTRLSALEA
jgi:hypothetical protein